MWRPSPHALDRSRGCVERNNGVGEEVVEERLRAPRRLSDQIDDLLPRALRRGGGVRFFSEKSQKKNLFFSENSHMFFFLGARGGGRFPGGLRDSIFLYTPPPPVDTGWGGPSKYARGCVGRTCMYILRYIFMYIAPPTLHPSLLSR